MDTHSAFLLDYLVSSEFGCSDLTFNYMELDTNFIINEKLNLSSIMIMSL